MIIIAKAVYFSLVISNNSNSNSSSYTSSPESRQPVSYICIGTNILLPELPVPSSSRTILSVSLPSSLDKCYICICDEGSD
jgi:hypothetical protein